ncbi:MAG: transcriptional regulator, ArsR family [Solirubrobacterales bacterium]|nr:transcriptional regulator, ArsR family [Solirubrobacterales bacterium]
MKRDRPELIDQRLVKALAHPLRIKILEILTERVASPNRLSGDLDAGLSHVAYHTRALDKCGCLELVDTAQRRGATEHFYKASPHSFIGDRIWRRVPRILLGGVSGATLQSFMDRAVAALEAGTIDGRDDTMLYWMPVRLDEEGWEKVIAAMEETVDTVLAIQTESRGRLARQKGRGAISAIVGFAGFETPGSREEAP